MTESVLSSRELSAAQGIRRVSRESLADTSSAAPRYLPRSLPFSVPRDQLYYWTREWQESEAEADEEIRRGELRRFSDIDEAMRWLDSPEY